MKTIIVTGMPRSGTSWMGQIFNSHPKIDFKMEPLFSYEQKNYINETSSHQELKDFIEKVKESKSAFMLQTDKIEKKSYPNFYKKEPDTLCFKTTRHHNLIPKYLNHLPDVHIVAIIRHPCGALNSWIKSEKEFSSKGCQISQDWYSGKCRKDGIGEYWGFKDWISTTKQLLELSYGKKNVHIVKYSELVANPTERTKEVFDKCGLSLTEQTKRFLESCHSNHHEDPYSVFKHKGVVNAWENELATDISEKIVKKTKEEGLSQFLS